VEKFGRLFGLYQPIQHILRLSIAQINSSGRDLPFFRKPELFGPNPLDPASFAIQELIAVSGYSSS
jgi:hypothetical protein